MAERAAWIDTLIGPFDPAVCPMALGRNPPGGWHALEILWSKNILLWQGWRSSTPRHTVSTSSVRRPNNIGAGTNNLQLRRFSPEHPPTNSWSRSFFTFTFGSATTRMAPGLACAFGLGVPMWALGLHFRNCSHMSYRHCSRPAVKTNPAAVHRANAAN